jgi:hypothetical protein
MLGRKLLGAVSNVEEAEAGVGDFSGVWWG